jgi:hypothetical protein
MIKIRKETKGSHAHFYVFVGPDENHLALSGCLILRAGKEAQEVEEALSHYPPPTPTQRYENEP